MSTNLQVQWFGPPSGADMVDRHAMAMPPLVKNGILFRMGAFAASAAKGATSLTAIDAYNGTALWKADIPLSGRKNAGHNTHSYACIGDSIFVTSGPNCCYQMDATTGKTLHTFNGTLPGYDWGYVGGLGHYLIGTSQGIGVDRETLPVRMNTIPGFTSKPATSRDLFVYDLATRNKLWTYTGGAILNVSITVNADSNTLYFLESRNAKGMTDTTGQMEFADFLAREGESRGSFALFPNEYVDARQLENWTEGNFDDSRWESAREVAGPDWDEQLRERSIPLADGRESTPLNLREVGMAPATGVEQWVTCRTPMPAGPYGRVAAVCGQVHSPRAQLVRIVSNAGRLVVNDVMYAPSAWPHGWWVKPVEVELQEGWNSFASVGGLGKDEFELSLLLPAEAGLKWASMPEFSADTELIMGGPWVGTARDIARQLAQRKRPDSPTGWQKVKRNALGVSPFLQREAEMAGGGASKRVFVADFGGEVLGVSPIMPWYGFLNDDDRRLIGPAADGFGFIREHQDLLSTARPHAPVAVVWSRRTMDHYGREYPRERYYNRFFATCQALLEEHLLFTVIPDDLLEAGHFDQQGLAALVLANVACLSDAAGRAVDQFVERGGGLVATFETGLYDEYGEPRADFGLKSLGVTKTGPVTPFPEDWHHSQYHSYFRLIRPDTPLAAGFGGTNILPFKGALLPVRPVAADTECPLGLVPPCPAQPPEKGWVRPTGDGVSVVVSRGGRVVYFACEPDEMFARFRMPDHRRLIANAVRSVHQPLLSTNAPPVVEVTLSRLDAGGWLLGLVNHSGARLGCPALPVRDLRVTLRVPGQFQAAALDGGSVDVRPTDHGCEISLDCLNEFEIFRLENT